MDILKNNIGLVLGGLLTLGLSAFLFMDASARSTKARKNTSATQKQITETNSILQKVYPAKEDGEDVELEFAITPENETLAANQSIQWKDAVDKVRGDFKKFNLKEPKAGLKQLEFSDSMMDSISEGKTTNMKKRLKKAGVKLGKEIPLLSFGEWINTEESGRRLEQEMIPMLNRRLQVTKEIVRIAIATKVDSIDSLSWPELTQPGKPGEKHEKVRGRGRGRGRDREVEEEEEETAPKDDSGTLASVAKWFKLNVKVTGDQDNVFAFMNEVNKSKVIMAVIRDFKIEAPNEFKIKEPVAESAAGNFGGAFDTGEEVELKRENYKLDLKQTCSAILSIDVIEVKAKQ